MQPLDESIDKPTKLKCAKPLSADNGFGFFTSSYKVSDMISCSISCHKNGFKLLQNVVFKTNSCWKIRNWPSVFTLKLFQDCSKRSEMRLPCCLNSFKGLAEFLT